MKGIYAPKFLKRRYSKKFLENRHKFKELDAALKQARLPVTTYELLAASVFYGLISFVVGSVIGIAILRLIPESIVSSLVSLKLSYSFPEVGNFDLTSISGLLSERFVKYYWLLGVIFGFVSYKLTRYVVLSYPYFVKNRRKGEIDLYLPHAINMMYGMAVGGLNPMDIFKEISKLEHLFGELSVEFREIVKSFEVFKNDMFTSIRYVRDTTPSKKLSAFLDNLIIVLQGGGSFSTYLKSKSEEFEEEQELTFSEITSFMEVLFEIYISIFMLFPLLLLIVLVVSKLVSAEIMQGYLNLMFVTLPIASVFLIYLARSSIPLPKMKIREFAEEVESVKANVVDRDVKRFKVMRARRFVKKVLNFLLHPYRENILSLNMRIVVVHLLFYLLVVAYALYRLGYEIGENYVLFVFAFLFILVVFVEVKNRIIKKAEETLPEFFEELAMLNESGVSIFEGLKLVSKAEAGILSKEFESVSRGVEFGIPITKSLSKLVLRIKSDVFAKAIPIAVKALETSTSIKDAFLTVARYVESEINFRKKLKSNLMPYVAIIYLSVLVFIFVSYLLISKFLTVFSGMSVSFMGLKTSFDVELIKTTFMRTILLVAGLSGLIAGAISEMNVEGGLKHALILTTITYLSFTHFIW